MTYLGDFATGATVRVPWNTIGTTGAFITRATDGSIRVYKDASTTQRSSSAGITDSEDFDALTGVHLVSIDLSDNTDAGFYAAGHDYFVVLVGAVVDGVTINQALASFSILNRGTQAAVVAALATDTYAEPSAVPAATASLKDKIGWLAALARNKITQTSTTQALRNDADSGNIATASVSDTGGTTTRGEWT